MTAAHHVELLLKLLISIVDTKLFETVDLKGLKPEEEAQLDQPGLCTAPRVCRCEHASEPVDVQNPDEGVLLDVGDQSFVDVLHNPVEQLGVDVFGESVAGVGGVQTWEGLNVCLCCCLQLPVTQPVGHVLVGDAHKVAERRQVDIVGLQREKRRS